MPFHIRRPSDATILTFLARWRGEPLSYAPVGMTAGLPPHGFHAHRRRILVGHGEETFAAACDALRNWEPFRLGWVTPCFPDAPLETGAVVGVLVRTCGCWSLNACRIVATHRTNGDVGSFGFSYGTLADHVERGEERFLIMHDRADDSVWFEILAHSRPGHWLTTLFAPLATRFQRRFVDEATQALRDAVRRRLDGAGPTSR